MKWFIKCLKNYVNFKGRARRAEYWFFTLYMLIFYLLATVLDITLFGVNVQPISWLLMLLLILPSIAVLVRRLHDIGRSGKIVMWYYIATFVWLIVLLATGLTSVVGLMQGQIGGMQIGFMVVVGLGGLVFLVWGIVFLVWCCTPGTMGDNKYGPDPKAVAE